MTFLSRIFFFTSFVNNNGSIGLIKGIETFEPNKGCQLTTYAAKCIENEILMYIRANKKHRQAVSLYESVGTDKEGNDIALMDVIPQQGDGYAEIENSIVLEKVKEVMNKVLSDPEREVISMRYGLTGKEAQTQSQVAKELNISRSYVSRIEKRAIGKITKAIH